MNEKQAVRKACDLYGGMARLAKDLKVTPPTISQWASGLRRVPVERCIQVEKLTNGGIRCEDLRPDVDWGVLRGNDTKPETNEAA